MEALRSTQISPKVLAWLALAGLLFYSSGIAGVGVALTLAFIQHGDKLTRIRLVSPIQLRRVGAPAEFIGDRDEEWFTPGPFVEMEKLMEKGADVVDMHGDASGGKPGADKRPVQRRATKS
jgi:hypothetical protein